MALFDRTTQKIVVRIAYDGPAEAGKTTNLVQLCDLFTTERRSEMETPEDRDGRTMYFDWLQLDGGLVDGYSLRSQIVTVPGQAELRHRRMYLLDSADVVVFVCEATENGLQEARPIFELLRAQLTTRGDTSARIVVQANKQDLDSSVGTDVVRRVLELELAIPVVVATATESAGVRETITLAIRAAANLATEQLQEHGVNALQGSPPTTAELYAAICAAEELVSTTMHPGAARAEEGRRSSLADVTSHPELPSPFVPHDFIWPRLLGREILHRMADDRQVEAEPKTSDSRAGRFVVTLPRWIVSTERGLLFEDEATAREALADAAVLLSQLGNYLHHRTVLCLQPTGNGRLWLWRLVPRSPSLHDLLERAQRADDRQDVANLMACFTRAIVDSVLLALRTGVLLQLGARSFGCEDEMLFYVGGAIEELESPLRLGYALLGVAECFEKYQCNVEGFALAMTLAIAGDSNLLAEFHAALRYASPRTGPGKRLQSLLLRAAPPAATERRASE